MLPTTAPPPSPPQDEKSEPRTRTLFQRLSDRLQQDINPDSRLLEVELLLLALAIGIQDAISFPDFHCFASNQTGNTVLFAVGILHKTEQLEASSSFSIATIAVSLSCFLVGVGLTGQIANACNMARRQGWLLFANLVSTALVYMAGILQWHFLSHRVGAASSSSSLLIARLVLALLAFASGSQVAVVRGLKITDITTAMATAAYIDIFIDPRLLAGLRQNRGRNRRVLFLAMLVAGSFVGAGVGTRTNFGVAVLVSAGVKTVVCFLLMCDHGS
ncbi:hypothetical protein ACEQ8H_007211 [Pleosporales sp. CAS-2024a]